MDAGAQLALVTALTTHAAVPDVCKESCWALSLVTASAVGKASCFEAGAPEALVSTLSTHAHDFFVRRWAYAALCNLAKSEDPAHRAAIVAAGAVPLIAAAHKEHNSLYPSAHAALKALGYSDSGVWRGELPKEGMDAARVAALMGAGGADVGVARAGAEALYWIAAAGDEGRAACVAAEVPRVLVTALTTHAGVADVCEWSCNALADIACCQDGATACANADAPRAVVAALTTHATAAGVCQNGCQALAYIVDSDERRDKCPADAPRAVVDALTKHAKEADVCAFGCWALLSIAGSDDGKTACVAADAPAAVVAALTTHAGVAKVCERARETLAKLGYTDEGVLIHGDGVTE